MKHVEAIVLSMTLEERKKPEIMNGSRRARVAKGRGRPISEVNRLLEQFREMQKMMKKVAGGSGPGGGGCACRRGCSGNAVSRQRDRDRIRRYGSRLTDHSSRVKLQDRVRAGNAEVREEPGVVRKYLSQGDYRCVKIRLRRIGRKKPPMYRIVVADSQSPRDGKFIEIVGQYAPRPGEQGAQSQRRPRRTTGSTSARSRPTPFARSSARPACSSAPRDAPRREAPGQGRPGRRTGSDEA